MVFTDIFNVKHDDCKIIQTQNDFKRVFIIENEQGVRFTCLKDDAPRSSKIHDHWKHAKPSDSPDAHPFHDKFV
ncbi:hypothetical protein EFS21_08315 [Levilactobacillus brevis]|jgi:hypothetical protein|uniref:hypothetical protein n=1 Tax=Levilactobacillus brevis TaxID=1580 RepID=UPI0005A883D9|nr:hypothetical protein [Levilactobacillus brevis]KWT46806.1 hypothetical protein ABB39_10465 [Levilactobacillus brevis]KWU40394.1 hypothetical protein AV935_07405 [Levilactobacillus brevis]MCB4357923.1 hypothetical protein [Levilactobacillus brevis]MCB4358001.1 hypothetical protein [Levilactobacillus brevis]MCS6163525.1 hypothetical protein [Levilactobacillus brevis]